MGPPLSKSERDAWVISPTPPCGAHYLSESISLAQGEWFDSTMKNHLHPNLGEWQNSLQEFDLRLHPSLMS